MARRALLSVSDKSGIVEFARVLARHGFEILSTGGTAKALREGGITVVDVSAYTGSPEILDGRVKTLHPRIHAAILARGTPEHLAELQRHGIDPIELVVVNLYPFRETIARATVAPDEAIEQIDIGGPTMVRAAAKNFERVGVVVDPVDYPAVERELEDRGALSYDTRRRLACSAFALTAAYDRTVAGWMAAFPGASDLLPERLTPTWERVQSLRYGENPHQRAALYRDVQADEATLAGAAQLQGKELSYNNLLDADAALALLADLPRPSVCIVKHGNPCGVALGRDGAEAFRRAFAADAQSAFGGAVAVTEPVDTALAEALAEPFLEVVIAPGFSGEAQERLSRKKNVRLLVVARPEGTSALAYRSISGGLLVQTPDARIEPPQRWRLASRRAPTDEELRDLDLAWRVCKHVKSNAIVIARGGATVGVGAGQMSRVESVAIAVRKAGDAARGAGLASDAFFPFRDGVDAAAAAGVTAIVHPGGSVRDGEVIAAADEHGMAMVLTGERHFRH